MKRTIAVLAMAAALVSSAQADELVLTNGKRVTWKTLTDNGDAYIVENELGQRIMINKVEVERIEKVAPPAPPPLAGAAFVFDKKVKLVNVNLLAGLDLKKAVVAGQWTFERGALIGTSSVEANSRMEFLVDAPQEYDLTIDVSRRSGVGDFDIGLSAGGRQFIMAFDGINLSLNGLGMVDGKPLGQHDHAIKGKFFVDDKPRTIVCMVRKDSLVVQVDGKDYLSYSGGWDKVGLHAAHEVRNVRAPFLVIWKSAFSVTRAVLSYPKTSP